MSDEMQALGGQENLEEREAMVLPVDEALPEKFRGKSVEDVIDMYRHLEADYGRKGQLLGEYQQRLAQFEDDTRETPEPEPEVDAQAMRCLPAAQAEYQRLLSLGLPESEETQGKAWGFALQQDAYLQQAIAQGVQAQLAPYASAIAPNVYGPDVRAVLERSPVQGVSPEELVAQLGQAGIPAEEWMQADPQQKLAFITAAAKQLAYDKIASGRLAPQFTPVAPSQDAPGVLGSVPAPRGGKDPVFEEQVNRLAETLGLDRKAAEEVLRGE